ncbi:DUF389 domain-containing protein [Patescibacteria group bacterium]|nr:DUF389 domain-containing protein [Patescibacteria group bacterium]
MQSPGTKNISKKPKSGFLRLFFLDQKHFSKTKELILDNAKADFDYIIRIVFAVIVISLGMLIDSTAVVIGGMLIAPLFWPIFGFAIGIVEGKSKVVTKSFFTLLKSLLIVVGIAIVIGLIAPAHILESQEFVSQTTPTLFDLLIGLASGFLGAFIVSHPKISSSFAGVVIAAAIVPPLAAVGIALAKGDIDSFGKALLLSLASLIAITFSASVLFYISHVKTKGFKQIFKTYKASIVWFAVLLIIVIIPLILFTNQIIKHTRQERVITEVVTSKLVDTTLDTVVLTERNDILTVKVTVHSKDEITDSEIQDIAHALSKELEESIVLHVNTIPVIQKTEVVNYE